MINRQRTEIPNWFLEQTIILMSIIILLILGYKTVLLRSMNAPICSGWGYFDENLDIECITPVQEYFKIQEVIEKINRLKGPEYVAHAILFFALTRRGWWQVGLASFPLRWVLGNLCLNLSDYFSN